MLLEAILGSKATVATMTEAATFSSPVLANGVTVAEITTTATSRHLCQLLSRLE